MQTRWLVLMAMVCATAVALVLASLVWGRQPGDGQKVVPTSVAQGRYQLVVDRYEVGVARYLLDTQEGRVWWWPNVARPTEGFVPIPVKQDTPTP